MPAKITFNKATVKGPKPATGYVALLPVGDKTVKFVLQDDAFETPCLTHYASGIITIHSNTVAARKLAKYVANPYSTPMTDRQICAEILNEIVNQHGAEKILAKFDAAKIINT